MNISHDTKFKITLTLCSVSIGVLFLVGSVANGAVTPVATPATSTSVGPTFSKVTAGEIDAKGNILNSIGPVTVNDDLSVATGLTVAGTADLKGTIENSDGDVRFTDNVVVTGSIGTPSDISGFNFKGTNLYIDIIQPFTPLGRLNIKAPLQNPDTDIFLDDTVIIGGTFTANSSIDAKGGIINSGSLNSGRVKIDDRLDVTGNLSVLGNIGTVTVRASFDAGVINMGPGASIDRSATCNTGEILVACMEKSDSALVNGFSGYDIVSGVKTCVGKAKNTDTIASHEFAVQAVCHKYSL